MNEVTHSHVTEDFFVAFCHQNFGMIYPAFMLQSQIIEKFGGPLLWQRLLKKRMNRFGDVYVPLSMIFEKHGNIDNIKIAIGSKMM